MPSASGVPRVIFDTVVFVRCLLNPHSPAARLVFQYWDRYELVLSRAILEEILEVLSRPEIIRKYPINRTNLKDIFDALDRASIVEVEEVASVSRDPKDDKFIAAACSAGAEYLVSEDKDLTAARYSRTCSARSTAASSGATATPATPGAKAHSWQRPS